MWSLVSAILAGIPVNAHTVRDTTIHYRGDARKHGVMFLQRSPKVFPASAVTDADEAFRL